MNSELRKLIKKVDELQKQLNQQNEYIMDLVGLAYEYEEIHQKDDFCGKYKAIFTLIE